jgi:hypothetical protein
MTERNDKAASREWGKPKALRSCREWGKPQARGSAFSAGNGSRALTMTEQPAAEGYHP